jgi:hypothetical protein
MKLSQYLYVFNQIISEGKKHDDKYCLHGLTAWHDLDGYTCYLSYKGVTMSMYFHGRFAFDCEDEAELQPFNKLVQKIYSPPVTSNA